MICWKCANEEATQIRESYDRSLPSMNICFDCAKLFDAETRGDATMEFLIKVIASDQLRQKDILEDIRAALHGYANSGDLDDPYVRNLRQVKVAIVASQRMVKKLKRPALTGEGGSK